MSRTFFFKKIYMISTYELFWLHYITPSSLLLEKYVCRSFKLCFRAFEPFPTIVITPSSP